MTLTPELEAMAKAMVNGTLEGDDVWETMRQQSRDFFIEQARAALMAIREPSADMVMAAYKAWREHGAQTSGTAFTTMIDHILGERG